MNEYLFYTTEGFTQSPSGIDCENLQILGFEKAEDPETAKKRFLKNNSWILDYGFAENKILSKRLFLEDPCENSHSNFENE